MTTTEPDATDPPTETRERSAQLRAAWESGETLSLQNAKERFAVSSAQFHAVKQGLARRGFVVKRIPDGNGQFLWQVEGVIDASKTALAAARANGTSAITKPRPADPVSQLPSFGAMVRVIGLRWNDDETISITLAGEESEWTFRAQRWFET